MLVFIKSNKTFTFTTDIKNNSNKQGENICVKDFGHEKHHGVNPKHPEIVTHTYRTLI